MSVQDFSDYKSLKTDEPKENALEHEDTDEVGPTQCRLAMQSNVVCSGGHTTVTGVMAVQAFYLASN